MEDWVVCSHVMLESAILFPLGKRQSAPVTISELPAVCVTAQSALPLRSDEVMPATPQQDHPSPS